MGENLQLFLCNRKLAREEYKSLMSEGYGELKSTCPLCSMKALYGGDRQDAVIWLS